MASEKVNGVEKMIVFILCGGVDIFCMAISLVPGLDLIGWPLKVFGTVSLNVYFLLKQGFGGTRSSQKMLTSVGTAIVDAIPAIDDFLPGLTIQSVSMYWLMDTDVAEAKAKNAANQNVQKRPLSRAA